MNFNLKVNEELKKYIFFIGNDSYLEKRIQYLFKFENGYGASVIKHIYSYGGKEDLWEVACVEWHNLDGWKYALHYPPLMDNDVIGWLNDEQVNNLLMMINEGKLDIPFDEVQND